jgi:hypothetical protein
MTTFPTVAAHLNLHLEEEVLPPCLPDMSNAPCRLTEDQSHDLNETIASRQTLKDKVKQQPGRTGDAERLALFQKLPIERQKSLLGLDDADKDNDSWGKSFAARNRASHKAAGGTTAGSEQMHTLSKQKIAESLKAHFPDLGQDSREAIADLFLETAASVSARKKLAEMAAELYNSNPRLYSIMFMDDQQIDACDFLGAKVEELYYALDEAEEEHARLLDEQLERRHSLEEETLLQNLTAPPASRRSLDPDFTFNGEEGKLLMGEEERHQPVDSAMAARVEFLNRALKV